MFGGSYRDRRVLVTGHTGFKGSWLVAWLRELGAQVQGLALSPPTTPNHWDLLGLAMEGGLCDVRDARAVADAVAAFRPEVVFHLAAQSLVRASYDEPVDTWATNVMGTVHVLEACRRSNDVRAIVVVTSDKCYENREMERGYREDDPLGGHDAYSASKAAAELAAASYRRAFFDPAGRALVATARAGNVVGGGDWSRDRLVPDAMRAVAGGSRLEIRSPHAVRPWQHVLDPLAGYLLLGQRLIEGDRACAAAWNFGPSPESEQTVAKVLSGLKAHWPELEWSAGAGPHPHEPTLLHLDSAKARAELGWQPVWPLERTLEATARWYRDHLRSGLLRTHTDLHEFTADAARAGHAWARA
ncbi:CDP-glucose 4,6-dehydratase [Caenimonas aquaedulcis]|uniref:CDP-glucose 4,6-dehydratase n=1 Tax=Caenimonas aquaedulcis TaxID=2793270 RepID=A0A931MHI7_9BURK|nr:CDP-glucose 4,6-dehydratase [Caenimonas aquaedulcis]MBG9388878.1 CDP-glucose 4,6-dehydratase [Caenimonas aquaedulcis]